MDWRKKNPFASDIEVPEAIQAKADAVFLQIRSEERDKVESMSARRNGLLPRNILAACLCGMVFFFGGIGVYAAANDINIGELFERMWHAEKVETVKKNAKAFEVIGEENTSTNICVEPVQILSDRYVTYVVLKVTGKDGFRLTEDMVVGENFDFKNKDVSTMVMDSFFLKKEGDAMYYGLQAAGECEGADAEFALENFYLERGGYDAAGWINQHSGERIGDGSYCLSMRCQVDAQHATVKADGVNYAIYSMGVHADQDVLETLEDPRGETWWDGNAWVVLRDGTEVAVSSRRADADGTDCVLKEPVDVEEIAGLKIGQQVYAVD